MATILRLVALDWIGCFFLDGDEVSSGVVGGVLHGDSSLLAMEMSESSITDLNKVVEKFGKPQLGHSLGQEDFSNTERKLALMLTQTINQSINQVYFQINMCKNEQKVHISQIDRKKVEVEVNNL